MPFDEPQRPLRARDVVRVVTLSQCRILRSFDAASLTPSGMSRRSLRDCDCRGMVFKQAVGTTILLVHVESQALSLICLPPRTLLLDDLRSCGVTNFGRVSQPRVVNTTRMVWISIPRQRPLILKA